MTDAPTRVRREAWFRELETTEKPQAVGYLHVLDDAVGEAAGDTAVWASPVRCSFPTTRRPRMPRLVRLPGSASTSRRRRVSSSFWDSTTRREASATQSPAIPTT